MINLPSYDSNWAIFLDLDGTLMEIADHPLAAKATPRMKAIVNDLWTAIDHAVAIVSGRNIADVDRFMTPFVLPVAGLHGLERRDCEGRIHYHFKEETTFHHLKEDLMHFVTRYPGLVLEDKGPTVAVHYRNAPEREDAVLKHMGEVVDRAGERFELQRGKMVVEFKPAGRNKGDAIREYMAEAPFQSRVPVFAGDDVTDEAGFTVVNDLGGHSIRVGTADKTAARFFVPSTGKLLDWLEDYTNE